MKLIFILFSLIIYNFLFSLTPKEIILSTDSDDQDKFLQTTITNCYDLEQFSKDVEIPFYIKYEEKGKVIWLQIYNIYKKEYGLISGTKLHTASRTWSDMNNDWLRTKYYTGCQLSLLDKNRFSFLYLYEPYKILEPSESGEQQYGGIRKDTKFSKIKFYFKPKRLDYTSEQEFSKDDEPKPKPKQRRRKNDEDDEDPEKIPLL